VSADSGRLETLDDDELAEHERDLCERLHATPRAHPDSSALIEAWARVCHEVNQRRPPVPDYPGGS
jgi:hypothetical protein